MSLPIQLPSTFNGEHGHVRYTAKVTIDIPWAKDKEKETVFEIISPLNLNDEPSLAVSTNGENIISGCAVSKLPIGTRF